MKLAHYLQEANRSPPLTILIMDIRKMTVFILVDREVKPYELRVSRNDYFLLHRKKASRQERIIPTSKVEEKFDKGNTV